MSQLALAGTTDIVLDPNADSSRDSWTTPAWLTELLPEVDLDPCSNQRSTVVARNSYSLETNQNGLELPWFGLVFVNGPFSNLLPWAIKREHERRNVTGCAFLVNADHSTRWWKRMVQSCRYRLDFDQRIKFGPPPGISASSNNSAQSLLLDDGFLAQCSADLLSTGQLWERQ